MKNFILFFLALTGQLLLAQQPKVLSTFPLSKSENLSCNTPIFFTLQFSFEGKSLRMETFSKSNIKLFQKGKSRKAIDVELGYDESIHKVIVKPLELLNPDTWYILSVSKKLEDDRGQPFLPYRLEFKTGDCQGESQSPINKATVEMAIELEPIKIANFSAKKNGDSVRISWVATESLLTESYFLEKSSDGQLFSFLGSIPALGGLEEEHSYVFFDPYPSSGESFYRLGSKHSLDEAELLDTLTYFVSGVQFPDRRITENEALPLLFYNKKPTSMVFVLKEPESGRVVFRQAKLLPGGKTQIDIPLQNVERGFYIALIQTTEVAVKTKIQID